MLSKKIPYPEKRKYKRLDTIFPVELQVLDAELNPASGWYQAFSQDISKGGICVVINNLAAKKPLSFITQDTNVLLQIHSPIADRCFLAYAKIAWLKKSQESPFEQYIAGVSFSKIDTKEIERLLNYVRFKKFAWRMLQLLIIAVISYSALVITHNKRLDSRNIVLFNKYSQLLRQDLELNKDYDMLSQQKQVFQEMLNNSRVDLEKLQETLNNLQKSKNQEIADLEKELLKAKNVAVESSKKETRIKELENKINELKNSKDSNVGKLEEQIKSLKEKEETLSSKLNEALAKESKLQSEFSAIEQETAVFADKFRSGLYDWLKNHQVQKTGLIVSFEGDYRLRDTTFIYDQALAVIAYTLFGDYDRAKRGLDFFVQKAERIDGLAFYNAYYSKNGAVAEYIAHAGPNLWLGMAILQYTNKTKDYTYMNLAEQIAKWINSIQDKEGGVIGGKGIEWYSTEHNLDAFAFFDMFYKLTKKEQYKNTAEAILNWLGKYAYGNDTIPVNRGKGDSTIATDTYAWSIAALGPKRLKDLSMDPGGILEFAIENCLVSTSFTNLKGKEINVSGFDFAKYQNIGRGGVVSCEWTAQMILSFNMMAEYYISLGRLDKANYYQGQTLKYLNELSKMVISSFSSFGQGGWCMPYASQGNVDTGHGWRTPHGNRTGSVAATAYTIFAVSKFNPLQLETK